MLSTGSASNSRSPSAAQHGVRVIVDRLDAGDLAGELGVDGCLGLARACGEQEHGREQQERGGRTW